MGRYYSSRFHTRSIAWRGIETRHLMSGPEEVRSHWQAHVAKADKSNFAHGAFPFVIVIPESEARLSALPVLRPRAQQA